MTDPSKDITWQIVLDHMHAMEKRIMHQMKGMEKSLGEDSHKNLQIEVSPIKSDLNIIKERLEHVEQDTFLLVNRSKPVQERLNTIENDQLPKMRKSIRALSKKFSDHAALPAHQSVLKI